MTFKGHLQPEPLYDSMCGWVGLLIMKPSEWSAAEGMAVLLLHFCSSVPSTPLELLSG